MAEWTCRPARSAGGGISLSEGQVQCTLTCNAHTPPGGHLEGPLELMTSLEGQVKDTVDSCSPDSSELTLYCALVVSVLPSIRALCSWLPVWRPCLLPAVDGSMDHPYLWELVLSLFLLCLEQALQGATSLKQRAQTPQHLLCTVSSFQFTIHRDHLFTGL